MGQPSPQSPFQVRDSAGSRPDDTRVFSVEGVRSRTGFFGPRGRRLSARRFTRFAYRSRWRARLAVVVIWKEPQ